MPNGQFECELVLVIALIYAYNLVAIINDVNKDDDSEIYQFINSAVRKITYEISKTICCSQGQA